MHPSCGYIKVDRNLPNCIVWYLAVKPRAVPTASLINWITNTCSAEMNLLFVLVEPVMTATLDSDPANSCFTNILSKCWFKSTKSNVSTILLS